MPVLPFHRYIGPGNPSDNGEPVDDDDRIAKVHDIKYDEAKTEEDVRKADEEAINEFRKSWRQGNWHSIIGDVGISAKYFVESYTGVMYPKIQPIQIEHNCGILHIKNILKLHCVFKNKPFLEKFESSVLVPSENLDYSSYDFVSQKRINNIQLLSPFVYVPIEWNELYTKYNATPLVWNTCIFCAHNLCDSDHNNATTVNITKQRTSMNNNSAYTRGVKADLFNVDFWVNVLLMNYLKLDVQQQPKVDSSTEELVELELFKVDN